MLHVKLSAIGSLSANSNTPSLSDEDDDEIGEPDD